MLLKTLLIGIVAICYLYVLHSNAKKQPSAVEKIVLTVLMVISLFIIAATA